MILINIMISIIIIIIITLCKILPGLREPEPAVVHVQPWPGFARLRSVYIYI